MGDEIIEFAFFSTAVEAMKSGFTILSEAEFRHSCGKNRKEYREWERQNKNKPIKAAKFPLSTASRWP